VIAPSPVRPPQHDDALCSSLILGSVDRVPAASSKPALERDAAIENDIKKGIGQR